MIRPEYIERIRRYGYTNTEARFLYLVATHSGYFTQAHFLRFAGVEKGGMSSRLIAKARVLGDIRTAQFGLYTLAHNLYRRRFYEAIEKDNLRNRRHLSPELIRTRLLILDFVVAHPDLEYLETEQEKVAYFTKKLLLSPALLPCRIYKGVYLKSETKRYFVDRFPIFLQKHSQAEIPTFVYCDHADKGQFGFISYLQNYEPVLRSLATFKLIYGAPVPGKFPRAQGFYTRLFNAARRTNTQHLARYFTVRHLWESGKTAALTHADRELLRQGDEQYRGTLFEELYPKWTAGNLGESQLDALVNPYLNSQSRAFETYLLHEAHDMFERVVTPERRDRSGTIAAKSGSGVGSTSNVSQNGDQPHEKPGRTL